jgi:hypothetical protein
LEATDIVRSLAEITMNKALALCAVLILMALAAPEGNQVELIRPAAR